MKVNLPVNVLLRCRKTACVTAPAQQAAPFSLFGHSADGAELWHRDGHWREDKTPHAKDIVGVVDPATGQTCPLTDQFSRK